MNRMWTMRAGAIVCTGATLLAAPALAGDLNVADIAPRDSLVVVSLKDYAAMRSALEDSGLADLWKDPRLKNFVTERMSEFTEGMDKMLEEMELEKEDIRQPKGALGAAMWLGAGEEGGEPTMQVVMLADFGDEAEAMNKTLVEVFERSLDEGKIDLDDEDYDGVTIYTMKPLDGEEGGEAPEGWDDEWGEWEEPSSPFDAPETMHYARNGDYLFMSSNLRALEDALDRAGGDDFESVRANTSFNESVAVLGDTQGYAAIMVEPLVAMMDEMGGGGFIPPGTMKAMGFDGIKAASIGLDLNSEVGVVDHPFAVLTSEKRGIVSLLDVAPVSFEPPKWIPADASSVSVFQFQFDQVLPTMRKVFSSMGDEGAPMLQGLDQAEAIAGPILANMGTTIVSAERIERPFSASSQSQVTGIGLRDSEKFTAALEGVMGGMLESRQFQGGTIWETGGMGGMVPIEAIGVGAGHLFVGSTQGVEDALRQEGGEGLANEPRFQQAMESMPSKGLGFGWVDLRQTIQWTQWQNDNRKAILEQQALEMFGDDPEFAEWREDFVKGQLENLPEWQKDMPDLSVVLDHLGDIVTEVRSTDDGFRGRFTVLKPRK